MSVISEINRIKENIGTAYSAIEEKGGELPSSQNSENLADAILNIPSGGGGEGVTAYTMSNKNAEFIEAKTTIATTGKTLSNSINCDIGDLIIGIADVIIDTGFAITQEGWTLLSSDEFGNLQISTTLRTRWTSKIYVYYKIATSTVERFDITQTIGGYNIRSQLFRIKNVEDTNFFIDKASGIATNTTTNVKFKNVKKGDLITCYASDVGTFEINCNANKYYNTHSNTDNLITFEILENCDEIKIYNSKTNEIPIFAELIRYKNLINYKDFNMKQENIRSNVELYKTNGTLVSKEEYNPLNKKYLVRVIDYDGTVLSDTFLNTGERFTLPLPPYHERLAFEGWCANAEIIDDEYIIVGKDNVVIGTYYTPQSFAVEVTYNIQDESSKSVTVASYGFQGGIERIMWGDGSTTGSTSSQTHTYEKTGKYTVAIYGTYKYFPTINRTTDKVKAEEINIGRYTLSIGGTVLLADTSTIKRLSMSKNSSLSSLKLDKFTGLKGFVFPPHLALYCTNCYLIENIACPYASTQKTATMTYLYKLEALALPPSVTSFEPNVYSENRVAFCYSLKYFQLPPRLTTLSSSRTQVLASIGQVKNLIIPDTLTRVPDNVATFMISLEKIKFPATTTYIYRSAFMTMPNLKVMDISDIPIVVPTSSSSSSAPTPIWVVADELYEDYIADSSWSSVSSYIRKKSDCEKLLNW